MFYSGAHSLQRVMNNITHWFNVRMSEQQHASVCIWWMMVGETDREQIKNFGSFSFIFSFIRYSAVMVSFFCVICRVSSAVLPEWRLMPCGETRACLHVSWTSPSHRNKTRHIYKHTPTHSVTLYKHAQTKINIMSVLFTPPSILQSSLWDLKHGNPIRLVLFLISLEKTRSMKHVGICFSPTA